MYKHNERIINNNNPSKVDNKFLDAIAEFIGSVESELDIMLYGSASLRFLSHYKIIDLIISQKLVKNIIIRLLCPLDEDSRILTKQLVPFAGYKSISITLPKSSANSSLFIRDKQDIFSFSIDTKIQQYDKGNVENKTSNNAIFSVNDWLHSQNVSTVRNNACCFDIIWEEKETYDKIIKEKTHSELLFDIISHDIGNYHQIIQNSLEIVTSLFKRSSYSITSLPQDSEKIISFLTTAKKALTKSQSLVDNIRRLERLYAQKDLKLILKNLPDVINNAHTTVEQTLYENNPHGKRIRVSINLACGYHPADINIIAEDLLEEIFINLFSNSVKYTESSEVKIDVLIKEAYFIGELK